MYHLLNESQTKALIGRCVTTYKMYKDENYGHLREDAYKAGMIDLCDNIIFVSSELTYDVATIRNLIEEALDEIDTESDEFVLDAPARTVVYTFEDGDIDPDTGEVIHRIEETDYLEGDDD